LSTLNAGQKIVATPKWLSTPDAGQQLTAALLSLTTGIVLFHQRSSFSWSQLSSLPSVVQLESHRYVSDSLLFFWHHMS
jgi:hypothetical protein